MEIYIEYALMENFLLDYALLYLATKAVKTPTRSWRIALSSCIGAVFAVLFPLLTLPKPLAYLLKIAVGLLMCLCLMKGMKNKNEWGMYALTSVFFFAFSFFFGGALSALALEFPQNTLPFSIVAVGFAVLTAFSVCFIEKLHQKRQIYAFLYECEVIFQEKSVKTQGFWDSGNLAMKNNLPVCFVCPSLFYDIFLEDILDKDRGHVRDEMQIHTLGGVKNIPLYAGELHVKMKNSAIKRKVYFAPSKNMLSREYSLLLPSGIFDGQSERVDKIGEDFEKTA